MKTTSGCNNHRAVWKALSICHSLKAIRKKVSVCLLGGAYICLMGHLKGELSGTVLLPWPHPHIPIHSLQGPKNPYLIKHGEQRYKGESRCPSQYQRLTSLYGTHKYSLTLRHKAITQSWGPQRSEFNTASKAAQWRLILHHTEETAASGLTFTSSWRNLYFLPSELRDNERNRLANIKTVNPVDFRYTSNQPLSETNKKSRGSRNLISNSWTSQFYTITSCEVLRMLPTVIPSFFIGKWR